MEPSAKRRRVDGPREETESEDQAENKSSMPRSLSHRVSPPRMRNRTALPPAEDIQASSVPTPGVTSSPFRLTRIRDLPADANRDTVSLKDLLGDPFISECWEFNYLHDVDFLMNAFDADVRHLVKVHIIHGFWKQEDPHRLALYEAASSYSNVSLHAAYLPEPFGTHHSKMLILLRHDETAQVIIHTANMIPRDWTNMTQGVWESPRLPLLPEREQAAAASPILGSGAKFKVDILNYLRAYDSRRVTCKPIVEELAKYDFSAIRGAIIASVPSRQILRGEVPTRFGWPALRETLQQQQVQPGKSEVVVQISSIATLGPTDKWLRQTLFDALSHCNNGPVPTPDFKVIFPTPDEIRRSLDGYRSGGSIHTKIQSAQQAKQLQYLKPIFCHWANDCVGGRELAENATVHKGGRALAAPHIKTYVRYGKDSIDWALMTSANMSKQAWGEAENSSGEVRIASYEIGVLVWPSLYGENAEMHPTFKQDGFQGDMEDCGMPLIALRIPYDLPLQRYGNREDPWVATATYTEPDRFGNKWE